ncbi:MAG TPA: type VI secretion system tube protein Hcp [Planctomycetaceae bacterium]|nr:type VI secretion system tube protein Hcp [Planctomycetaceae bacterium]
MAVDMFLLFNSKSSIKGETQDKTYAPKDGIDVLAWSWGMSQSGSFHVGAGGGAGKANFQDISLTKWIDKSTPNLMLCCATGKHIDDATLIVRKAGEKQLDYIKIKMEQVMVTSVSSGGSGGEDRLTENITLNFAKVTYSYFPQKSTGGVDAAIDFKYDIAQNTVA